MKKNKIKAAIIIDDGPIPFLIWDLIDKSLAGDKYEVVALLIQKSDNTKKNILSKCFDYITKKGFRKFLASSTFAIIKIVEKFFLKNFSSLGIIFDTKDIESYNCKTVNVYPKISKSGLIYRYSDKDIEKIKNLEIDVLIRGGNGILKGKILDSCSYGVLSFHHANNDINRGGPAGFWEVAYKYPSTGFIIQRLSEELDGGDVILKGEIKTSFYFTKNWARICIKSNHFLHLILSNINQKYTNDKFYPKKPYAYPLYITPSISNQLKYIYQTFIIIIRKLFKAKTEWSIAYQFVNSWDSAVLRKSLKIKNPPNRFFADPFIKHYNNRNIIFVEDFDNKLNKAAISAIEINDDKSYTLLGEVIEESFHLSYPYIFELNNEIYMCPESQNTNEIRLYKCLDFPMKWKFEQTLIDNISAADTNIFYHNNLWWIMTNIDSSDLSSRFKDNEHDSELHIFYSKDLNSKNWTKHPNNPVIFDSNQSRNAGKINLKNGELYRVYQSQGFDLYGEKFGIAKILELSPDNYKEEILFEVPPLFYNNIIGTHHYSFDNKIITFDYLKGKK